MSRSPFYDDPQFISLYRQYESSARALQMAVEEACRLLNRESLPGPRRQVDLHKLNQLRRFLERDAYKVFTYRGHSSPPLPPETHRREARGLLKDAITAQSFGKGGRAEQYITQTHAKIEAMCKRVWAAYSRESDPKSEGSKRALLEAVQVAQLSMLESNTVNLMTKEIQRLTQTGQIKLPNAPAE